MGDSEPHTSGISASPVLEVATVATLPPEPGRATWTIGRGAIYIVAGAFAFSIMTAFVKIAGQRLPSQEIVAARAAVSLVLSWLLLRRENISPWGTHRRMLVMRGLLGYLALSCVFTRSR